ncbi:unnamed protein product [Caenorhabditis auriculariae]|uniref:Uncharacterized protein n=1 Tax=Caenorhabditis auriculariae TaxID=2777116 RepID=A0A8S1HMX3_9PELO|nr:unnamed protein product [Caenorhabditis auriculariae]
MEVLEDNLADFQEVLENQEKERFRLQGLHEKTFRSVGPEQKEDVTGKLKKRVGEGVVDGQGQEEGNYHESILPIFRLLCPPSRPFRHLALLLRVLLTTSLGVDAGNQGDEGGADIWMISFFSMKKQYGLSSLSRGIPEESGNEDRPLGT